MSLPTEMIEYLKNRGERLTVPRRLVIEALHNREDHLTINDICQFIDENHPGHNLAEATIYRILQWLKGLQLVCQTDMGKHGIVYAFVGESPHHHLICLHCGQIIEVEDELFSQLREELVRNHQFEARIEHMAIYGFCHICSSSVDSQSPTDGE